MPSKATLRNPSVMQSMVVANYQDLEVYELQVFVNTYLDQVANVEAGYVEIYNHLSNEFGLLQQKVMMKMDQLENISRSTA
jgi:hypothetical protein